MNSAKMKSLQNYKTMEEQLKTCLPLEVFLAQELVSQKSLLKFTPIVLTGLFSGGRSSEILAFATVTPFRLLGSTGHQIRYRSPENFKNLDSLETGLFLPGHQT